MGENTVTAPNSVIRGYGRIRREGHIEHAARRSKSELRKGVRVVSRVFQAEGIAYTESTPHATSLLPALQRLPTTLRILNAHHGLKGPI